ncbi:MAG: NAD-dependent succinate-semialdehyde dehydrogenase [Gammaproteobacteria bacterium]|nr:NAD-dependent succinate-semialdehyde dehydrogenase [Gammaproteobacteria bacterium]
MTFMSINPATGETLPSVEPWDEARLEQALAKAALTATLWAGHSPAERAGLLGRLAPLLRAEQDLLARLITQEMGKLLRESRAEIEKCVWGCEHYAEHGVASLADEQIKTDASQSYVTFQPLGTVLAIMPWNFPFWQVFRCALPALLAGNTVLLKHASTVPHCALAIEALFIKAGLPEGVFQRLMITSDEVEKVIADPRVHAVSLTGSVAAGRQVAGLAGIHLKKLVLELGGSDPFIVLDDADLEFTVQQAVTARFQNAGQSCIAAKRFIVTPAIAESFIERFRHAVEKLTPGDPMLESTSLAPLARISQRDALHQQVTDSIAYGAAPVTGCAPLPGPGAYYAPSILDHVGHQTRAYHEELFGPVACVIRAGDEEDAVRIANDTRFGLGGSVWTRDAARGERLARRLQCGLAFVNGVVKSDPRLPFGGVKDSGYGRELSHFGVREFVNIKTVWIK